jgi:two-component system, NarL family, nitrate/nitrite response regulator NarL
MSVAVLGQRSLLRAGLVSLLTELGYERVGEAASLADLEQIKTDAPDIELLLVHLSDENADIFGWMKEIREWLVDTKVVFLFFKLNVKLMSDCFAAGASGYLLENLSRDALRQSLTLVRTGEKIFPSELASLIADFAPKQDAEIGAGDLRDLDVSDREMQILGLLGRGYANKLIAAALDIAESTVKVHIKHILRKTRASNRTQAALWAVRSGIVLAKAPEQPRGGPAGEPPKDVAAGDEVPVTTDQGMTPRTRPM